MICTVILLIFNFSYTTHLLTAVTKEPLVADFSSKSYWHSPNPVPNYEDKDCCEIDPVFDASRRAIPGGPNPLHN